MDVELTRYLNDHLAGSAGALDLIGTLEQKSEDPPDKLFFADLKAKVENDRNILKELLSSLGESHSSLAEAGGNLTLKASKLKLQWEGLEPGHLGMFEALELLALGIQGKRLLWVMLAELEPWVKEWEKFNFAELELQAIEQRDAVEQRRVEAGVQALVDPGRVRNALPSESR